MIDTNVNEYLGVLNMAEVYQNYDPPVNGETSLKLYAATLCAPRFTAQVVDVSGVICFRLSFLPIEAYDGGVEGKVVETAETLSWLSGLSYGDCEYTVYVRDRSLDVGDELSHEEELVLVANANGTIDLPSPFGAISFVDGHEYVIAVRIGVKADSSAVYHFPSTHFYYGLNAEYDAPCPECASFPKAKSETTTGPQPTGGEEASCEGVYGFNASDLAFRVYMSLGVTADGTDVIEAQWNKYKYGGDKEADKYVVVAGDIDNRKTYEQTITSADFVNGDNEATDAIKLQFTSFKYSRTFYVNVKVYKTVDGVDTLLSGNYIVGEVGVDKQGDLDVTESIVSPAFVTTAVPDYIAEQNKKIASTYKFAISPNNNYLLLVSTTDKVAASTLESALSSLGQARVISSNKVDDSYMDSKYIPVMSGSVKLTYEEN